MKNYSLYGVCGWKYHSLVSNCPYFQKKHDNTIVNIFRGSGFPLIFFWQFVSTQNLILFYSKDAGTKLKTAALAYPNRAVEISGPVRGNIRHAQYNTPCVMYSDAQIANTLIRKIFKFHIHKNLARSWWNIQCFGNVIERYIFGIKFIFEVWKLYFIVISFPWNVQQYFWKFRWLAIKLTLFVGVWGFITNNFKCVMNSYFKI